MHWRWVFLGLLVMVLGHVAAYALLADYLTQIAANDALLAFGLFGGLGLSIYFLGGLLVGRLSPGTTIQEPAVAGLLGVMAVFLLQLLAGMINVFGLVVGAPFCFAMAYLGGGLGERWQEWARRRRAARS